MEALWHFVLRNVCVRMCTRACEYEWNARCMDARARVWADEWLRGAVVLTRARGRVMLLEPPFDMHSFIAAHQITKANQ
jgi:hypothetical protein